MESVIKLLLLLLIVSVPFVVAFYNVKTATEKSRKRMFILTRAYLEEALKSKNPRAFLLREWEESTSRSELESAVLNALAMLEKQEKK